MGSKNSSRFPNLNISPLAKVNAKSNSPFHTQNSVKKSKKGNKSFKKIDFNKNMTISQSAASPAKKGNLSHQ